MGFSWLVFGKENCGVIPGALAVLDEQHCKLRRFKAFMGHSPEKRSS